MKIFILTLLFAGSALAASAEPDLWWAYDKKLHLGASALISGYGYGMSSTILEKPWQKAVAGASLSFAAGIGKEAYDVFGGGQASWKDMTWNVVGTAVGVGVSIGVDYLLEYFFGKPQKIAQALR